MRELTKTVFAEGNTIDGARVDKALNDVVTGLNALEPRHLAHYTKARQVVWGWEPFPEAYQDADYDPNSDDLSFRGLGPFAPLINGATGPNPVQPTNPIRIKGCEVEGLKTFPVLGNLYDRLVWSVKIGNANPTLLTDVAWLLQTDDNQDPTLGGSPPYTNTFQYDFAVGPYAEHDFVRDFQLVVEVASHYAPESSIRNAIVSRKYDIPASGCRIITERVVVANYHDMLPAFTGGVIGGLWIKADNIAIPIPENGRCKISLVLPYYSDAKYTTWKKTPVVKQAYSGSASFLDSIVT